MLYMKLTLDLPDNLLLKMLPADFRSGMSHRDLGLSELVVHRMRDKEFLKKTVLNNLDLDLPALVLKSHYVICEKMQYVEALEPLYHFIISQKSSSDHDQISLTEIYLKLGGSIKDFKQYITVPSIKEDKDLTSWNWYLMDKYLNEEPVWISQILLTVIHDVHQPEHNQIRASELLIRLNKTEGLEYWSKYIKTNHKTPFEHRKDFLSLHIGNMAHDIAIGVLFETFEFVLMHGLDENVRFPDSIKQPIFKALTIIAAVSYNLMKDIEQRLTELIRKHEGTSFIRSLKYYKERIKEDFYNGQISELSICEIDKLYFNALQ
jgi:hypothetical protein